MPNYRKATRKAARRYGVRPELLEAQIKQESGFNPRAGSPAGARGIAQFMPGTAATYGVNLNDNRASDDLDGAARHMRDLLKKYKGNEGLYERENNYPIQWIVSNRPQRECIANGTL